MSRKANKPSYRVADWGIYRRQKRLVLNVLIGYLPVIALCLGAFRLYPQHETLISIVFCLYILYWTYIFLNFLSAPCAACGANLSGSQLYSKKCMKCGAPINPPQ